MVVRYKLDTCGVKLKLDHWHKLRKDQREYLVEADCNSGSEVEQYRGQLQIWIEELMGKPASTLTIDEFPEWLNGDYIPEQILLELKNKLDEQDTEIISISQWQRLTPLQRFALIKLSRSGHENRNFIPALREFNLIK
jgi:hypothetical protein